jgi:hypothetical protein
LFPARSNGVANGSDSQVMFHIVAQTCDAVYFASS